MSELKKLFDEWSIADKEVMGTEDAANTPDDLGFLEYTDKNLDKVNNQRRALSTVYLKSVPVATEAQTLLESESELHNQPTSCYNCIHYDPQAQRCSMMGGDVVLKKFIYSDIEYWPDCGYHVWGRPHAQKHQANLDPDKMGLGWINAPEPGLEHGGANCGGANGGDDCDNWLVPGDDKREYRNGFCRVMQKTTGSGVCCCFWQDDDWMSWQVAQDLIKAVLNEDSQAKQKAKEK